MLVDSHSQEDGSKINTGVIEEESKVPNLWMTSSITPPIHGKIQVYNVCIKKRKKEKYSNAEKIISV